jgi:hypothetical protein
VQNIETFRRHIEPVVRDPEGIHHEFVTLTHGQKIDFDKIDTGSPLYDEWVEVNEEFIREQYPVLPEVLVGVANGTNRLALSTAKRFGCVVFGVESEKDEIDNKIVRLTPGAVDLISCMGPDLVVVQEDTSTFGTTSVQVALGCLAAGAKQVEVVTTWQRRPHLERLVEAGIPYRAIIRKMVDTFSPEDCQAFGHCSKGWNLIRRNA